MSGKCCEPGTIQAFLDGELTADQSSKVTNHIADCDACAVLLARAEEEMAIVFPALEREFNSLVPTQRLWTRINESIVEERRRTPFWQKLWAGLVLQIANPSIAAAAGVLIIFVLFAGIWSLRNNNPADNAPIAKIDTQKGPVGSIVPPETSDKGGTDIAPRNVSRPVVERASYSPEKSRIVVDPRKPQPVTADYLPGEASYVKTIENLSQTVDGRKDTALRPSARVNFERDMAVVNDAIKRMKGEVRKNPKNESAKQVLYSSYQNKIDLLNSVAEKEELMASLK
jgi:hypothetical protein